MELKNTWPGYLFDPFKIVLSEISIKQKITKQLANINEYKYSMMPINENEKKGKVCLAKFAVPVRV